jgi:small conductance mechanosensitive channel
MDPNIAVAQVDSLAGVAWSWTAVFAPRVMAAAIIIVGGLFLSYWLQRLLARAAARTRRFDPTLLPVLMAVIRYSIIILMVLLVLNQLGIQTTSLIALLGAAGLALGLALQGTLSNIAAGIMLLWLRPFRIGDYIAVNNMSGRVEETGLFACIIRTYDGARLFAPNSTLWNFALRNETSAPRRMVAVNVTIAGDGDEPARSALEAALGADPAILKQPAPEIFLDSTGAGNATLTCIFWTSSARFGEAQRMVTTRIREGLKAGGIAPADIQGIVRITPAPADPTRLIDL